MRKSILIFGCIILLFAVVSPASAWLSGYSYRKPIYVNNTGSTTLTNYQVGNLTLSNVSVTETSTLLNLTGVTSSSWNDVRVTDSSDTLQNYTIFNETASTALLWWMANSLPVGNNTYYIYWGKSGDSAASNGDNTFMFWDDFTGSSVNTTKWTETLQSGVTSTVSNGYYNISGSHVSARNSLQGKYNLSSSTAIEESLITPTTLGTKSKAALVWRDYATSPNTNIAGFGFIGTSWDGWNTIGLYDLSWAYNSGTNKNSIAVVAGTAYHYYVALSEAVSYGTTIKMVNGGTKYSDNATIVKAKTLNPELDFEFDTGTAVVLVDWIFVRAYTTTEPTLVSGATETSAITSPVASFTVNQTSGASPLPVAFTDTSTNTPASWIWNYTPVSTGTPVTFSTSQNPTHTFTGNDQYQIALTATNAYGSNTSTQVTWVNTTLAPGAAFISNVSAGSIPLSVSFTDESTNTPTAWLWTFGDGGTNTTQNATHTFTTAGNWSVTLNATNSYGSTEVTHYILATSPTGIVRQDLYMDPLYTLTLTFVDSSSGDLIPVVMVLDPTTGTSVNTTVGIYTGTFGYQTVVLYCYADGYTSKAVSYVMTGDRTETVQLVKSTTSQSANTNIIYTQQQVRFIIMNSAGTKVNGALISASVINSTLPADSLTILEQAFGIDTNVAEIMLNGSEIMSGTTVGDGSLTFMMFPSLTYNLTITNVPSEPWYISVSPRETEYTIHQPTANATSSYSNYLNTSITITEPNSSYVTFNAVFQDLSGATTNVKYYVVYRPNNTIIYYRDMGNPGTSAVTDNSVTLPNIRGVTYWAYFNKTTA